MAVPSSGEALTVLGDLMTGERPATTLLHEPYLPEPADASGSKWKIEAVDPTEDDRKWVWGDDLSCIDVGGYGKPGKYRLDAPPVIWKAPSEVLPPDSGVTAEERRTYCRHSVDLTMRGGTTSGVVYPLAVCEIARDRRIRNVGGASAGAIAAAAAAAAEYGRSYPSADPPPVGDGHFRPGFPGLADIVGWLCQVSPHDGQRHDEYRLAQLFRPAKRDRPVYALATAAMRKRLWALPLIALLAFYRWSKLVLALLVLGAVATTAAVGARIGSWPALDRSSAFPAVLWACLDLSLFFVLVAGVWVLLPLIRSPRVGIADPPGWLTELSKVSSASAQADRERSPIFRTVTASALFATPLVLAGFGLWQWTVGVLVGTGLSAGIVAVVGASVFRYQAEARKFGYGLIAGATPASSRSLSELLAATAKPTVDLSLMPWLGRTLRELAGLPEGQPLRFGHLWQGPEFRPAGRRPADRTDRAADDAWLAATEEIRALAADPRARSINLELITTDLTRQRPYRFPLDAIGPHDGESEQLYVSLDDLAEFFDDDVLRALVDPEPLRCASTDGRNLVLHRLPDPWDLPVAFAVRLSVALPGLFKAVRMYRLVRPAQIHDDFGRLLRADGVGDLCWPSGRTLAEELWFSDGGITSNFPVHLFDTLLPSWPTFGLNLGSHPEGHPHQDVWLPQDWQATRAPSSEVRPAATSFLSALVDTARSWRDTMQTGMPGYRGRVAWVRQRSNEGGTNLYMPREVIASLALRGALAGARLRRRFGDATQTRRYLWLRMRTALANAQHLRDDVRAGRAGYDEVIARDGEGLAEQERAYVWDPYSEGIDWYCPDDERFWAAADQLLRDFGGLHPDRPPCREGRGAILRGSPVPYPSLRQIPPM
ncbi:patatin-like phospholipase family protein [Actinoplanes sp. Pm04-4]|uniref:Patatin-like phospholipase family protein n=1 Tax=Paractinoplanes pyxinae TaxID=2997416 RepID=A0ABT4AYE7_9ACTN|nr:patatin-like phospholipase family protein [Actinoplanes pyxinae]MCY1139269.1 patatin-like phospholipase family protein [Actinoplanes pyxinae]